MKLRQGLLGLLLVVALVSCKTSPKDVFQVAVSSTYSMNRFGANELQTILSRPSLKFDSATKNMVPTSYQNIIQAQIDLNKEKRAEVMALKAAKDADTLIKSSLDFYNYIIQVQATDYLRFAKMKDQKVPDSTIFHQIDIFWKKNQSNFENKIDLLWGYGKMYADTHRVDLEGQPNQQ